MIDGEQLRRLRRDRGWSQPFLAERSGVGQWVISDIERNKTTSPRSDVIRRLAKAFDLSVDAFLAELAPRPVATEATAEPTLAELADALRERAEREPVRVPRVRTLAHAGAEFIPPDQISGWEYVGPELRDRNLVAVEITGRCLEPDLMAGDVVIADCDAKWQAGKYVVGVHDGMWVCKRLEGSSDAWRLTDNQGEEWFVTGEGTRVVGVVFKRVSDI